RRRRHPHDPPAPRERLTRPRLPEHADVLVEQPPARRALDPRHLELLAAVSHAGDEAQAPAGDERRRRELLGEPDRIVQRDEDGGHVDGEPLRARGDRRRQGHRRRHVAVLDAVALRDRDHVETPRVGPLAHVEAGRVLPLVPGAGEGRHAQIEPETHHGGHGRGFYRRRARRVNARVQSGRLRAATPCGPPSHLLAVARVWAACRWWQPKMRDPLARRTLVVTGASSGIGRALCLRLAARGMGVVAAARSADALRELAREAGAAVHVVQTDVTREESVAELRETARRACGRVDVVVNNAGVGYVEPFASSPVVHWHETLATNLIGALCVTRAFLPLLLEGGPGLLVDVGLASVGGRARVAPAAARDVVAVEVARGLGTRLHGTAGGSRRALRGPHRARYRGGLP